MSNSPASSPGAQPYAGFRSNHRQGVSRQMGAVLLHPIAFFTRLPALSATRQWLWAALIILALVGFSAVRQAAASPAPGPTTGAPADLRALPGPTGSRDSAAPPAVPEGSGLATIPRGDPAGALDTTSGVSTTWTTALTAAAGLILQWLLMALLFMEASLLSGLRPSFSAGLHIAIWASVPLGLMAALQIVYMLAGGSIGAPGVSGLVGVIPGYAGLPALLRAVLDRLAGQLTLFWLWSLALALVGLRHSLRARWGAALFTVLTWAGLVILIPAIVDLL